MVKFKSTNAEELTELSAWTVRDHLGEFVNFYISDGEDDSDVYLECALNAEQVSRLISRLNFWLDSKGFYVPTLMEGDSI